MSSSLLQWWSVPQNDVDLSESSIDFVWRDDETMEKSRRGESAFRTEGITISSFPLFRSRVILSRRWHVNQVRQLHYLGCFLLLRRC
ncbi:unnamed protein product [Brassica rapa subsp. trilocularis]